MDSGAQPALLSRIANASTVLAPTLLRAEVGNGRWKYVRAGLLSAGDLPERHHEALSLIKLFVDDAPLFPEVLTLSARSDHPVCDALYAPTRSVTPRSC